MSQHSTGPLPCCRSLQRSFLPAACMRLGREKEKFESYLAAVIASQSSCLRLTSRWMAVIVAAAVRTSGSVPSLHLALQLAYALAHEDSRMHIFLQHTLQRGRSATVAVLATASPSSRCIAAFVPTKPDNIPTAVHPPRAQRHRRFLRLAVAAMEISPPADFDANRCACHTSAAALRAQRTAAVGGPRLSHRFQRTRARRTCADLRLLADLAVSTQDRPLTATLCTTSLYAQIDS